jgi:decaprenyl-phosphate phosphoribosyltransferase
MTLPGDGGSPGGEGAPDVAPSRHAALTAGEVVEPAPRLSGIRGGLAWGMVRAMRPRQWVKNGLVLAAPLAAGAILHRNVLGPTCIAFVLFCLASAGVYVVNDIHDIEEDRRHPRKRFRPIAAGVVPIPLAIAWGITLLVVAVGGAVVLSRPALAAVIGSYVVLSLCYSFFLKNQAVVDMAVVASGFLLRGVAGGVAAGLQLSQWFLMVAAFGSLFMVAGKRYSELVLMGDETASRRTLRQYSASYLRFVWSMSAGVACTAYSLWAFELGAQRPGVPWATISIAPFVLGVLRYAVDIDKGAAGEPEEIVLGDRILLAIGALWALTVGIEIFAR